MKIVSAFTWGNHTMFVTDTGDVWLSHGTREPGVLLAQRYTLYDTATDKPIVPPDQTLRPGSVVDVLFVVGETSQHVWHPYKVTFVGETTFMAKPLDAARSTGTGALSYSDEGKHWRRT